MKLLKIIFIILILVTLGEVGYYFIILNKGEVNTKPTTSQTGNRDSQSIISQVGITSISQRPEDALISQETLDYLAWLKKNLNQKVHLKTETSGFVAGIDETTDKKAYILKIVDNQGKKVMNYVLDKQIEDDRNFYLVEGVKKTKITINDLKVNDRIIVEDEHELQNNIINISFLIYR